MHILRELYIPLNFSGKVLKSFLNIQVCCSEKQLCNCAEISAVRALRLTVQCGTT